MAKTLGVELSPTRCTLVLLARRADTLRVKTLSSLEIGSDEPERLAGELRRLRTELGLPRRARVAVWAAADLVPTPDGDYRDRVEALHLAGVSVESAVSPPEALAAVAASLGPPTTAAIAYLAVNPDGAALAVVRDGELLLGQELESGPIEDPRTRDRRALARRLGAHITRALRDASAGLEVERLVLCGALPNLRSLTLPLTEVLARPVETLDTLEGIDTGGLTMPILDFQKQVAGLRLAWAMAADERVSDRSHRRPARSWIRPAATASLLTAAAAALIVAWWPEQEQPVREGPAGAIAVQTTATGSQALATGPQSPFPGLIESGSPPPSAQTSPPASGASPDTPPATARSLVSVRPRGAPTWRVRSILLAPERRLALVDGRIVGPGDRVGGVTVVDITEEAVVFTDAQGRRQRMELPRAAPGVVVR